MNQAAELETKGFEMPVLKEDEFNAGIIMDNGRPAYWLILLPGDKNYGNWDEAVSWAIEQGGELPTSCEQSLLFANQKEQFKKDWHWSGETHASFKDCAWYQHFGNGYQLWDSKSGSLIRARAVRRVLI